MLTISSEHSNTMYAIKFMTALSLVSLSLAAPVQYGSGSLQYRVRAAPVSRPLAH